MRSNNFNMELMVPMQNNKEIIFNESISTFDNFCNSSAISFIAQAPMRPYVGQKYIIDNGEYKNNICYCVDESKNWQFLMPFQGMIIFVKQNNSFYIYVNDDWQSINLNANSDSIVQNQLNLMQETEVFKSIRHEFELTNDHQYLYLYLNGDCSINIRNLRIRQITIIIKQNFQDLYKISWPDKILWKDKIPHQMLDNINSIDVVNLYRLPETDHYLGEIIGQNYNF